MHWCLWTHNGQVVDKNDKVIINSPETVKALEYAKKLYDYMIPGMASWNDASNNKAFLAEEIHWTNNGISIYVAAKKNARRTWQRTWITPTSRSGRSASRPSCI